MPVTRELTVNYGGFTLGGSGARQITEWTKEEDSYEFAAFECEFVTTATTEAAFATEVDAVREAFRKPRQALLVTQGSATILSWSQTANTGFDANPSIIKDGDPADTGRSRHFRIRIEFGRPADNLSLSGRRGSTVKVEYTPSRRRTVTISGTYTATGSTASLTQYTDAIAAYETSALSTVDSTATWERIGEPQVEFFETNKVLNFSRVYREVNVNQSGSSTDEAGLINPQLTITREKMAPGDSVTGSIQVTQGGGGGTVAAPIEQAQQGILRPIIINANYESDINFSSASTEAALNTLWTGTIRPWIIQEAKSAMGANNIIIIDEQVTFDRYENRIKAIMQMMALQTDLLRLKISVKDTTSYGKVLVPVWDTDVFSYYEFQGPVIQIKVFTEEYEKRTIETDANKVADSLVASPGAVSSLGDDWVIISRTPTTAVMRKGLVGGVIENIAEVNLETVLQKRHKKSNSGSSGGLQDVITQTAGGN